MGLISEFWGFMKVRKKFWLLPIIIVLVLLGALIVFILIFIPTGLIMKLLRKDPMKRKMLAEETYWEPYELEGLKDRNRYERQF